MSTTFAGTAKHYFAGFLACSWNGGIGAVAGILGIDGASTFTSEVHALNWREMGAAFIGACVLHGILWLKAHPLPETYDSTAPFFPTAKGATPANPPSKLPDLPTT